MDVTSNTLVICLQIRREILGARMIFVQYRVRNPQGATTFARAPLIKRRKNIGGTAEVPVASGDASSGPHPAVESALHDDDLTLTARGVERF